MFECCQIYFSKEFTFLIGKKEVTDLVVFKPADNNHFLCVRSKNKDAQPLPIPSLKGETWHSIVNPTDGKNWWYLASRREPGGTPTTQIFGMAGIFNLNWTDGSSLSLRIDCETLSSDDPGSIAENILNAFIVDLSELIHFSHHPHWPSSKIVSDFSLTEGQLSSLMEIASLLESIVATYTSMKDPSSLDSREKQELFAIALQAQKIIKTATTYAEAQGKTDQPYVKRLTRLEKALSDIVQVFQKLGIQNIGGHIGNELMPRDRRCQAIYNLKSDLFSETKEWPELADMLDSIKQLPRQYLGQLYSHWCFTQTLRTLIECFRFRPFTSSMNALVNDLVIGKEKIILHLHHPTYPYGIELIYKNQPETDLTEKIHYHYDIMLRFNVASGPNLFFVTKFRTKPGMSHNLIHYLIFGESHKKYSDLLFAVQPKDPAQHFFDCKNWTGGSIYASVENAEYSPHSHNIHLAILQWLQRIEYLYSIRKIKRRGMGFSRWQYLPHQNLTICANCGNSGDTFQEESIPSNGTTVFWVSCPDCNQQRGRTHCFACGYEPLFKNPGLNYFETSDAGYNIICPRCGMKLPSRAKPGINITTFKRPKLGKGLGR